MVRSRRRSNPYSSDQTRCCCSIILLFIFLTVAGPSLLFTYPVQYRVFPDQPIHPVGVVGIPSFTHKKHQLGQEHSFFPVAFTTTTWHVWLSLSTVESSRVESTNQKWIGVSPRSTIFRSHSYRAVCDTVIGSPITSLRETGIDRQCKENYSSLLTIDNPQNSPPNY